MIITAALLLALVLFATLLASGNNWSNVLSATRNDLVFAGRNRAYGAYAMRREHHMVMLIAFLASLGLVGAGLALPSLFASSAPDVPPSTTTAVIVELEDFFVKPEVKPLATKTDPTPPTPKPKPDEMINPIVVDSAAKTIVDTLSRPVDPGPKGPGGPDPKGPDPIKGGGGSDPKTIFDGWAADVPPEYPGGLDALYKDLKHMVRYPDIDIDAQQQGKVLVGFVVAEDGSVTDAVVMRGVSPTLDAEALRVVRNLKKWKPGQFKGRDVKVRYSLPIVFRLAK